MKNLRIMLSMTLVCIALAVNAGDNESKKPSNNSPEAVKIESVLKKIQFGPESRQNGVFIVTYRIDENNVVHVQQIEGNHEGMKSEIFEELNGKKLWGKNSHEVKTLKVVCHII